MAARFRSTRSRGVSLQSRATGTLTIPAANRRAADFPQDAGMSGLRRGGQVEELVAERLQVLPKKLGVVAAQTHQIERTV